MSMVRRNHELVDSIGYTYEFAPEVEAWREVAEDIDSDASVNLAGKPVMEDLLSSLLGLCSGSNSML
ncbi:hypothetical protein AYI68_g8008 [Smittium mucronatum]|uniref:Uncharacterized protein n=1 Tax=Smittium mucronatum TaxID=133383 RepID=A0A1R0GM50_9FUNG|nr:hypothetical protein AYI68_g8008 [Smittium mucronatum]